jgi:hypothetical protein
VIGLVADEPPANRREGTLDEERLVTVQEIGGARRRARQRREAVLLRARPLQNASTVCR